MIVLQHAIIDVEEVIGSVVTHSSGAVDVFIGTTRNHAGGKSVKALEYEAYEPMAVKEIERISADAKSRWKVENISVVHRMGRVPVGEASVVIAVSSAHRAEAFEACRYMIDTLKETVPIWKKEEFTDGTIEWSKHKHEQSNL